MDLKRPLPYRFSVYLMIFLCTLVKLDSISVSTVLNNDSCDLFPKFATNYLNITDINVIIFLKCR